MIKITINCDFSFMVNFIFKITFDNYEFNLKFKTIINKK